MDRYFKSYKGMKVRLLPAPREHTISKYHFDKDSIRPTDPIKLRDWKIRTILKPRQKGIGMETMFKLYKEHQIRNSIQKKINERNNKIDKILNNEK